MKNTTFVNVIGCGYAGMECALFLASLGIKVHVFDGGEGHRCACKKCEDSKTLSLQEELYSSLLKKELALLCSPLIKIEQSLERQDFKGCKAGEILTIGKEKLQNNKNIEYFNISINELNPKEINIVASGSSSDKGMYQLLLKKFGSMKCVNYKNIEPLLSNVNTSRFYIKDEGNFILPLSYQEYISFINHIVKAINSHLMKGNFKLRDHTMEELVCQNKDALKNYAMMPIYIENLEKPYAAIRIKKEGDLYKLCDFGSKLEYFSQEEIFRSLPGFEEAILERASDQIDCVQIKPKYVINDFCQSQVEENLFFAGSILGISGYEKCIASGHFVAREVFRYLNDFDFIKFPSNSLIGDINNKILCKKPLKLNENIKEYDIMKGQRTFDEHDIIDKIFEKSSSSLARFKEEYFYGKHF